MKSKPAGGVRVFLIVTVTAIAGAALAAGAFAGKNAAKPVPRWPVGAYSHPLRRAHSARAALTTVPLAGVSAVSLAAVKGTNEVYIGHRYSPTTLDCEWERIYPQGGAGGCSKASEVESKGVVSLYEPKEGATPHITAFVPDGVSSVIITDADGSSHAIAVTNNLALYEDANDPSTVSYTLPNGVNQTTNVAAWRTTPADKP